MNDTTKAVRTLPLVSNSATSAATPGDGRCGCGGCGCDATSNNTNLDESSPKETDVTPPTYSQSYPVTGMTCGHCVASVTEEIQEIAGVREVDVDLLAGATSTVTVTSDQPLEHDAVKAAITEAGYQLA